MRTIRIVIGAALCVLTAGFAVPAIAAEDKDTGSTSTESSVEREARGRYLVKIAGCNDCHTAGYAETAGEIPEKDWLTGDRLGWRGPWGTTYPSNLRLYMQQLTEEQWILTARSVRFRPPMPWFTLRDMTDQDLRAIYRFIRWLGPAGEEAPDYLPPDQIPPEPYITVPSTPK